MSKVDSITVFKTATIKEAMEKIDKSGLGMILVIDENKKLIGIITDGDIRRAFLVGKNLETKVEEIMITNFVSAKEGTSAVDLLEMMVKEKIYQIPIVEENGILKDIVLLRELKNIPLSSPDITNKEIEIINQVISSPYLSLGPKIKEFEKKIADYIGIKYAIAVNSGTSGLHLCIRSLDIKDDDEVITTPFSFIASANCILFERARPVFVDIDEKTFNIDVDKIEEKITAKTKAILPVHIFGYPCEMDKIMEIAKKHKLAVIEDACEALGSEYKNKKIGSFGNAAVFGFYPNKQITTGEGGVIITNDEKIAKLCKSMRNQGRDEEDSWLFHSRLGYNYRMTEISAALGCVQMERIEEIIKKRQAVANFYNKKLADIKELAIPYIGENVKISWFVYIIKLDERFRKNRDKIIEKLKDKGISVKNYFPSIHLEPFYAEKFGYKKGDFPLTERISDLTIALPFYNNLEEKDINYICENLKIILKEL